MKSVFMVVRSDSKSTGDGGRRRRRGRRKRGRWCWTCSVKRALAAKRVTRSKGPTMVMLSHDLHEGSEKQ
jgi:hypothetical protein